MKTCILGGRPFQKEHGYQTLGGFNQGKVVLGVRSDKVSVRLSKYIAKIWMFEHVVVFRAQGAI
jgi:hypothetical protein